MPGLIHIKYKQKRTQREQKYDCIKISQQPQYIACILDDPWNMEKLLLLLIKFAQQLNIELCNSRATQFRRFNSIIVTLVLIYMGGSAFWNQPSVFGHFDNDCDNVLLANMYRCVFFSFSNTNNAK